MGLPLKVVPSSEDQAQSEAISLKGGTFLWSLKWRIWDNTFLKSTSAKDVPVAAFSQTWPSFVSISFLLYPIIFTDA